jgi:hypothetical protein
VPGFDICGRHYSALTLQFLFFFKFFLLIFWQQKGYWEQLEVPYSSATSSTRTEVIQVGNGFLL